MDTDGTFMSSDVAIYLSKTMLWYAVIISAPVILAALVVGLLVSVFQVVTQIQDATLSFVPKIIAVVVMLMIAGEWMLQTLVHFTKTLLTDIPGVIG